jgi:hypothetical protein
MSGSAGLATIVLSFPPEFTERDGAGGAFGVDAGDGLGRGVPLPLAVVLAGGLDEVISVLAVALELAEFELV